MATAESPVGGDMKIPRALPAAFAHRPVMTFATVSAVSSACPSLRKHTLIHNVNTGARFTLTIAAVEGDDRELSDGSRFTLTVEADSRFVAFSTDLLDAFSNVFRIVFALARLFALAPTAARALAI